MNEAQCNPRQKVCGQLLFVKEHERLFTNEIRRFAGATLSVNDHNVHDMCSILEIQNALGPQAWGLHEPTRPPQTSSSDHRAGEIGFLNSTL